MRSAETSNKKINAKHISNDREDSKIIPNELCQSYADLRELLQVTSLLLMDPGGVRDEHFINGSYLHFKIGTRN